MNQPKRPPIVTLLALGVLSFTVLNTVRFGTAITDWDLLKSFVPRPGPLYIALTGLIWAVIGLSVYVGLWIGRYWARLWTTITVLLYTTYYWFDRLVFQNAVPRFDWPFALTVTFLWWVLTAGALFSPASRKFFTKREDNE